VSSNLSSVSSSLSNTSSSLATLTDFAQLRTIRVLDDFLDLNSWTIVTGGLGETATVVNGALTAYSHFGVVELSTSAATGGTVSIEKLGQKTSYDGNNPITVDLVFGFSHVNANHRFLIGYFNSVGTTVASINSGFGIEYNAANSANLQGITSTGTANTFTRASLGIAAATGTVYVMRIVATTSSVDFYQQTSLSNFTLITSITTSLNILNVVPTIKHIKTAASSNQAAWCDVFYTERGLNKFNLI